MIIKITRDFDKYKNLYKKYFKEVDEAPFEERITHYPDGGRLEETYHDVMDMEELVNHIGVSYFDDYTAYATFLIAYEAKFKALKNLEK